MARLFHGLGVALVALRRAARFLFGTISWTAPAWPGQLAAAVRRLGGWMREKPARAAAVLAPLLVLLVGGPLLRQWYVHRPKPVTINVTVTPPGRTPIEEKIRPRPLLVDFDASVAPIKDVGKVVTAGVTLAPPTPGTWKWVTDQQLSFVPRDDWAVGGHYELQMARTFVARHVRLDRYEVPFSSAPFEVEIAQAEFYQDPTDQSLKKVVATFSFSHPVEPATFARRVALHLTPADKEDRPSDPAFRVTYDKLRGRAFVHSLPLEPPRKDATLTVTLKPGTRAARGGPEFGQELTSQVTVPGIYNFLKVAGARVDLVDNERYEPEQVLFVETTAGVTEADLGRALSAYLLPNRDPEGKPARWQDPAAIGPEELARSQRVALTAVASEKEYDQVHGFKFQAPVQRQLYVRVAKGLRAFGGYLLGDAFQAIVQVPPYRRQVKLLGSGSLLSLGGEKKVSVYARDVPALRIEIGRVLPHQIQHLVALSRGTFARPTFDYGLDDKNLTEVSSQVRVLEHARPGKPQYEAVDLQRQVEGAGAERRGLFLLKVESWDPQAKSALGESDQRLILVTNLGIVAKRNADDGHDVFVQSIATGQPVAGATVSILGLNGLPVVSAATDAQGHCRFVKIDDVGREKTPTLFLVTSGADQSFLPFGRNDRLLDTTRFDVGGVREEGPTKGLNAYLFSDRGLYRPGDEIRVGMIVKSVDWTGRLEGLPLEAVVTDARGLTVKKERFKLSGAGFEEIRHTTPEIAPTGTYTVGVYVIKNDTQDSLLGSTTVEVREFLPDRMKIRTSLTAESPEGWVSPRDLKARVSLANLFGTPAAGRRVRASLTLSPWVPMFGKLRAYHFFDPMRAKEGITDPLPEARTNDEGEAELDLGLGRFAPATYRLRVVAEGFEAEGGRSVTAEVSQLVSPLPFLVGWKPDGDLAYVKRETDRSVELVAIDPLGRRTAARDLQAVLVERRYVSVLMRQDNGTYRYQSVRKDIERQRTPIDVPAAGRRWKVPTETPGDWVLSLRNGRDEEQQRIPFSVAGVANLSRDLEKNAELTLALGKTDVEPGDDLEVQIKAPFTGAGLITIERDRVYAWKWFKATTTASIESIKIPAELEGGGYVSVSFVRDPGSPEVFMSPLSYGVAPFSVSRAKRKLGLVVKAPEMMKPGQPMHLRYHTDREARVVLFAVDEGILRVAGYKTPDPLGFFFEKRALGVATSQILDMILPEYQRLMASLAPGGDGEGALGANLNPFRRRQQKPVACWSGLLDAGAREKDFTCDVPDHFNGTLRVMAVGVAPDAVAAFEEHTLVRGDFVIAPNAPTFLAPGDESDVTVAVTNAVIGSGKNADVTLALKTGAGLELVGDGTRKLAIGELREGRASFRVRARPPLGSASLTFTAAMAGGKSARLTTELSVRPASPYVTTFSAGHLRNDQVKVNVPRTLYGEYRTLEAGLSYLPLGLAHGLVGYLEKFPHGCTEQVTSQAMPAVALAKHPEFGLDRAKATESVNRVIAILRTRQNEDGSFGRWAANPAVDQPASVWATHLLWEARERGFTVPSDLLARAFEYLRALASQDADDLPQARMLAHATYLLAAAGGAGTARLVAAQVKHLEANNKDAWRGDLAGLYLASASKLLKQDRPGVAELQKMGQPQPREVEWYSDRLGHDAQVLYLLARHFPERARGLTAADITGLAEPIFNGDYTTQSAAWAILALETYGRVSAEAGAGKLAAAEIVDGQPRPLALPDTLLPLAPFSERAAAITFSNDGRQDAYYVVGQRGFDRTLPAQPITQKVEAFREFTDADGNPVRTVRLGDEVRVHLRLRALGTTPITQVALVDLLPGGFEPVVQVKAKPEDEPAEHEQGEGESEGEAEEPGEHAGREEPSFAVPIALGGSTFEATFGDVREDRVVLYGTALPEVKELVYAAKATNTGTYVVPPVMADALYDRSVLARGVAGKITVTEK